MTNKQLFNSFLQTQDGEVDWDLLFEVVDKIETIKVRNSGRLYVKVGDGIAELIDTNFTKSDNYYHKVMSDSNKLALTILCRAVLLKLEENGKITLNP